MLLRVLAFSQKPIVHIKGGILGFMSWDKYIKIRKEQGQAYDLV